MRVCVSVHVYVFVRVGVVCVQMMLSGGVCASVFVHNVTMTTGNTCVHVQVHTCQCKLPMCALHML